MSSYPYPYDVRLLEDAPKATEAGKLVRAPPPSLLPLIRADPNVCPQSTFCWAIRL